MSIQNKTVYSYPPTAAAVAILIRPHIMSSSSSFPEMEYNLYQFMKYIQIRNRP